jgi:hypothetical protein
MAKRMTPFRLDPKLVDWLDQHARERGWTRTKLVSAILQAFREGRLREIPAGGPNAFPGEELPVGLTPDCPALIGPSTRDEVGAPGWMMPGDDGDQVEEAPGTEDDQSDQEV